MKRIALISDTHGKIDDRMINICSQADEVWHAGDIGSADVVNALRGVARLRAVAGNIDGYPIRPEFPDYDFFTIEQLNVLLTHVGGRPGRYSQATKALIDELHPDILVCGHSHILLVVRDAERNMLVFNPGAAGLQGFHQKRTLLTFSLDSGAVSNVRVHEWPRFNDI